MKLSSCTVTYVRASMFILSRHRHGAFTYRFHSVANTLQDYAGNVELGLFQADSVKHFTKNVYVEVYQTGWEISELPVLKWFFHRDENSTSSDPVISISIPFTRNATPPEDHGKPVQI